MNSEFLADLSGYYCSFTCNYTWTRYYKLSDNSLVEDFLGQGNIHEKLWSLDGDSLRFYDEDNNLTAQLRYEADATASGGQSYRFVGKSIFGPVLECICSKSRTAFVDDRGELCKHCAGGLLIDKSAEKCKVIVGDYSSFGNNVVVTSGNRQAVANYNFANAAWGKKYDTEAEEAVHIGSDVRIKGNVVIETGANIGDGAIVESYSLVKGNVPEYSIVSGNPAKVVGYRFSEEQISALKKIAWWNWDESVIADRINDITDTDADRFINKYIDEANDNSKNITLFIKELKNANSDIYGEDLINQRIGNEHFLLISHDLENAGASIALLRMAIALLKIGKSPIVICARDGNLKKSCLANGIPAVVYSRVGDAQLIKKYGNCFKMVVANTAVNVDVVNNLSGTEIPVMWWIHETRRFYEFFTAIVNRMPDKVMNNIRVVAQGYKAKQYLEELRPEYEIGNLCIYVPEKEGELLQIWDKSVTGLRFEGKKVYANVGAIYDVKGQDINVKAIRLLPEHIRSQSIFLFVGMAVDEKFAGEIRQLEKDYPDNVKYIGIIENEKMPGIYNAIDCLICSSREETGPFVVVEAWKHSRAVILSENAGVSKYVKDNDAAIVYGNNSPEQLAEAIEYVHECPGQEYEMLKDNGRKAFERYFRHESFVNELSKYF